MSTVASGETSGSRRSPGAGRLAFAAALAAGVILVDQSTKLWAGGALAGHQPVSIIDNFFHLTYHRNTGGVFGLFAGPPSIGRRLFFILATLGALGFIAYLVREWGKESMVALIGLALVAGGAIGNLIDRMAYGEVIDFIDWHWYSHHWPAFNVADSAITCGTALLLLTLFLDKPFGAGG